MNGLIDNEEMLNEKIDYYVQEIEGKTRRRYYSLFFHYKKLSKKKIEKSKKKRKKRGLENK